MREGIARLSEAPRIEEQRSEMPPPFRPVGLERGGTRVQPDGLRNLVGFHRGPRALRQLLKRLGIRIAKGLLFLLVFIVDGQGRGACLALRRPVGTCAIQKEWRHAGSGGSVRRKNENKADSLFRDFHFANWAVSVVELPATAPT